MANPIRHAESSVKLWGGKIADYLPLHTKMDCSKSHFSDNRHRTLTHTGFWIWEVMIPLYGEYITNSDGKTVSVKDICEYHILEDYGKKYIPTVADFLSEMEIQPWMANGMGTPPFSQRKRTEGKRVMRRMQID